MSASFIFLLIVVSASVVLGWASTWFYYKRLLYRLDERVLALRADRRRLTARIGLAREKMLAGRVAIRRLELTNGRLGESVEALETEHAELIVRYVNLENGFHSGQRPPLLAETSMGSGWVRSTTGRGSLLSESKSAPAYSNDVNAEVPATITALVSQFGPETLSGDWLETVTSAGVQACSSENGAPAIDVFADGVATATPSIPDPLSLAGARRLIAQRDAEIVRLRAQLAPLIGLPLALSAREAERDRLHRRLGRREQEYREIEKRLNDLNSSEHLPRLSMAPAVSIDKTEAPGDVAPQPDRWSLGTTTLLASDSELIDAAELETMKPGEPRLDEAGLNPAGLRRVVRFQRAPAEVDNLKRLRGVGPVLERILNRLGVYQYRQIACWSSVDIAWFDGQLEDFRGRIERDGWVAAAALEHDRKYGRRFDADL